MNDTLKPTPVSVTTPMTMPTVAAAARPPARTWRRSRTTRSGRGRGSAKRRRAGGAPAAPAPPSRETHRFHSPNTPLISPSSTRCEAISATNWVAVVPLRVVNSPTRMHDEMPVRRRVGRRAADDDPDQQHQRGQRRPVGAQRLPEIRQLLGGQPAQAAVLGLEVHLHEQPKKCMNAGTMAAMMIVW